jgi:heat-inducible transcriptional repressor
MEEAMSLSPRKKKILQVLVDEYITTATPVSSKSISENYLTDISSATVRNELSALEEMGYLSHLHTSSGRVPSPLGYKFYVNELMEKKHLTRSQLDYIKSVLSAHADSLEQVVKSAVKVISEMTDYTSVAMTNMNPYDRIETVKLLRIKPTSALLLIVTEGALLKDNIISIPEDSTDESIESATKMLDRLMQGKMLSEIAMIEHRVSEEFGAYREVFERIERMQQPLTDDFNVLLVGEFYAEEFCNALREKAKADCSNGDQGPGFERCFKVLFHCAGSIANCGAFVKYFNAKNRNFPKKQNPRAKKEGAGACFGLFF